MGNRIQRAYVYIPGNEKKPMPKGKKRPPLPPRKCDIPECEVVFVSTRPHKRHCSYECRKKAYKIRAKLRRLGKL